MWSWKRSNRTKRCDVTCHALRDDRFFQYSEKDYGALRCLPHPRRAKTAWSGKRSRKKRYVVMYLVTHYVNWVTLASLLH